MRANEGRKGFVEASAQITSLGQVLSCHPDFQLFPQGSIIIRPVRFRDAANFVKTNFAVGCEVRVIQCCAGGGKADRISTVKLAGEVVFDLER